MKHGKVDANQAQIVAALTKAFCTVHVTSDTGDGFTDIVVWTPYLRRLKLIEIKDGAKIKSKQQLTPAQVKFHEKFKDKDCHVVNSIEQAFLVVGIKP